MPPSTRRSLRVRRRSGSASAGRQRRSSWRKRESQANSRRHDDESATESSVHPPIDHLRRQLNDGPRSQSPEAAGREPPRRSSSSRNRAQKQPETNSQTRRIKTQRSKMMCPASTPSDCALAVDSQDLAQPHPGNQAGRHAEGEDVRGDDPPQPRHEPSAHDPAPFPVRFADRAPSHQHAANCANTFTLTRSRIR